MGEASEVEDGVGAAGALDALGRVLDGGLERDSNAARILSYVVTETVEGRAERIKAVSIAQDVLNRGEGFDPATDSGVRVEMKRLRERLAHYYATDGAADPVRIAIPKGRYVPRFDRVAAAPAAAPARRRAPRARTLGVGGAVLAAAALVIWAGQALRAAAPAPPPVGEPTVAVTAQPGVDYAADLARDTLARFRNLTLLEAGDRAPDYRIHLSAPPFDGDAVEVMATLVHVSSREVLATRAFEGQGLGRLIDRDAPTPLRIWLGSVARRDGPIEVDAFARLPAEGEFGCSSLVHDYFARQTDGRHAAAVGCIDRLLRLGANGARVRVDEGQMAREAYTDRRGPAPEEGLERALVAARLAIAADPRDSAAYYTLMTALYVAGATEEAHAAGRRAVALNPFDPSNLGGFAARMNVHGRHAEALAMIEAARRLAPGLEAWADYQVFLAHFALGQEAEAGAAALSLRGSTNPLYLAALAVGAPLAGRDDLAAEAAARLRAVEPTPARMYARRGYDPALAARLVAAIESATARN